MFAEHSKCASHDSGEELSVRLSGEIDHHSAATVRECIDREMMKYRPKILTLDLGDVSFMDSSGLGLVLGRSALGEDIGTRIRLCSVNARIMKMLVLAGVDRIKNISIEKKGEK